jgi:hypothetical protein
MYVREIRWCACVCEREIGDIYMVCVCARVHVCKCGVCVCVCVCV